MVSSAPSRARSRRLADRGAGTQAGAVAEIPCPACGHPQDGGDECRKCGVVFAKVGARSRAQTSPGTTVQAAPRRLWMWGLVALAALVGIAVGAAWNQQSALSGSDAYAVAARAIRDHDRVRQILGADAGEDLQFGRVSGQMEGLDGQRRANLAWAVTGPAGKGRATVEAEEGADGWAVDRALFRTPDGDVFKLDPPRAPEPFVRDEPADAEVAADGSEPDPEAVAKAARLARLLAEEDEPEEPSGGISMAELLAEPVPVRPDPNALDESKPSEKTGLEVQATAGAWAGWYRGAAGFERARAELGKREAPLVLYFHASWCSFCRRLERDYLPTRSVRDTLTRVTRVELEPESDEAVLELARKFGVKGYPTVLVFPAGSQRGQRVHPFRSGRAVSPTQFAQELRQAAGIADD
jgi:thiol-disulfide isomerase/thioredoxin